MSELPSLFHLKTTVGLANIVVLNYSGCKCCLLCLCPGSSCYPLRSWFLQEWGSCMWLFVRAWSLKEWMERNKPKLRVCWSAGNMHEKARQIYLALCVDSFQNVSFLEAVWKYSSKGKIYIPYLGSSTSSYK